MRLYRRIKTFLIIASCLTIWLCGIPSAWSQSEHNAKLIEGAKKEGNLVWYTSMNISDSRRLLDAFEKKYGFVKTELFRATGDRTINRIMTETRAGRWKFDVLSTSGISIHVPRNILSPYASPEVKAYSHEFKDEEHRWTAIYNNYYVIGYNTNMVPQEEAPKAWEDLVDPKWKGKVSIDQEEYRWYATLFAAWGRERALKYMRALATQNIQWRRGHTLIAQQMAAGEFPLAIVYAHRIEGMKKKGAPLEWVDTLDPIVVSVSGIGISARPNNPNMARLFIDFVISKEGQEMIRSFYRITPRSDVEPLSPKLDPANLKLKLIPQDMATRYTEYVEEFRNIFGFQ